MIPNFVRSSDCHCGASWGEHSTASRCASPHGQEFCRDQASFDRLADADTVGDQQPRGLLGCGHHQRYELIVARADGQLREGAERASRGPKRQAQRVAQQPGPGGVTAVVDAGRVEDGGCWPVQLGQQHGGLVVAAAERADQQCS